MLIHISDVLVEVSCYLDVDPNHLLNEEICPLDELARHVFAIGLRHTMHFMTADRICVCESLHRIRIDVTLNDRKERLPPTVVETMTEMHPLPPHQHTLISPGSLLVVMRGGSLGK